MSNKIKGWILTDADSLQYRKESKLGEGFNTFTFKEFERNMFNEQFEKLKSGKLSIKNYLANDFWIEKTIDLSIYTKEQAWNHVSAYYTESEFNDMWEGSIDRDIIAECIFEQESGLY